MEAPALPAHSSPTADIPYRAFRCVFPGFVVLVTHRRLSNRHGVRNATPDLRGGFSLSVCLTRRVENRVKLIRRRQRATRFHANRGSRPWRARAGFFAILYDVFDPGKYRASHHLSPAFCPGWAFFGRETPIAACVRTPSVSSIDSILGRNRPRRIRRPRLRFDASESAAAGTRCLLRRPQP